MEHQLGDIPMAQVVALPIAPERTASTALTTVAIPTPEATLIVRAPPDYVARHIPCRRPANWTAEELDRRLDELDRLSTLLDSKFHIPLGRTLTGRRRELRIGLDTIAEFIPVVGPTALLGVEIYIAWHAQRFHLPKWRQALIAWNLVFDYCLGVVPGLGIVLTSLFKANKRNVAHLFVHFGRAGPNKNAVVTAEEPPRGFHVENPRELAPAGDTSPLTVAEVQAATGAQ